jgi:hypothetical protein
MFIYDAAFNKLINKKDDQTLNKSTSFYFIYVQNFFVNQQLFKNPIEFKSTICYT